jgi:holo-[acyl-carrier protein] synthase
MIFGVGVDIVEIARISYVYNKFKDRLPLRILSSQELLTFNKLAENSKVRFLAKRFAAKEAVAKCLKCGIGEKLQFTDITIKNDDLGAPFCRIESYSFTGAIEISISDEKHYVVANAIHFAAFP